VKDKIKAEGIFKNEEHEIICEALYKAMRKKRMTKAMLAEYCKTSQDTIEDWLLLRKKPQEKMLKKTIELFGENVFNNKKQ
jgi:DNA-binding transcriptional regulator YiaG